MEIWNPWHGCKKYSEGCENCYMYFLDKQRDKDGSIIHKVKTNFNLPLKKNRQGEYKIPSGTILYVCMTSDFFLEEADEWRKEVWEMIKKRPDITFWIQTKRVERIKDNLPKDWNNGYENVILVVTTENEKRAKERLPIFLEIPSKRKGIMCAPMLSKIHLEEYLKTNQFEIVLVDGENYEGNRPLYFDWVKILYEECIKYNIEFQFIGTGNVFIKDGKTFIIPKAYQKIMAQKSELQNPPVKENLKIQKKCKDCFRKNSCNGCKWCGKCT